MKEQNENIEDRIWLRETGNEKRRMAYRRMSERQLNDLAAENFFSQASPVYDLSF